MTNAEPKHRALVALGVLVVAAAISVPTALASMSSGTKPSLDAAVTTPVESPPRTTAATVSPRADDRLVLDTSALADSIADRIIERLALPTGPVLAASPVETTSPPAPPVSAPSVAPAVSEPPPPVPLVSELPAQSPLASEAPAEPGTRPRRPADESPTRNRAPLRGASDDRIEVEVYGAAIPEPPEVASSTTTETVLVEPDPSDPWAAVRECESSGNYRTNTGNGFYGAYQFTIRTWNWVAGIIGRNDLIGVRPDLASPADQDRMANALAFEVRGGGLGHWPVCGRLYGS